MSDEKMEELEPATVGATEENESFGDIYKEFEKANQRREGDDGKQIRATVVKVTDESVFLDIGYKTEGVLPVAALAGKTVEPGDTLQVSSKGRNEEGYYDVSLLRVAVPKDWSSLTKAFEEGTPVTGTVTGVVKGGLTVDVGVRAFMPASRSGVRDAAEMEKLVGTQVVVKLTKVDEADEDVVVDRRSVLEAEEKSTKERRFGEVNEGDVVTGTVRSLADYGAFVELGGVDGLLHISDISWQRVANPSDVLTVGDQIQVKVLKVDAASKRIGLGMKQLLPHPWDGIEDRLKVGDRLQGTVTRATDFGGFVEVEPGVEGMVHVSEMSWAKKVRKASDVLKAGDSVSVIVLGISVPEKRMALGLKQALGDPWEEVAAKFPAGSTIEGKVSSFTTFGAFVTVEEGVEGMIHISEIVADKRLNHPSDALRVGQVVKAKVLEIDRERRQMKLSMKQLIPTGLDEFVDEHAVGDVVSGRIVEIKDGVALVELGEGIRVKCAMAAAAVEEIQPTVTQSLDLSALTTMLSAQWKGSAPSKTKKSDAPQAGQMRSFRLTGLDKEKKSIDLEAVAS
ncbi:small subunit ribosomal protein S1 [Granulicella pectinivorans]|uniref:Small subunit ribosomal protein S1 n=1 Tax=Granulicella pectinivorans TaxID=474950 RepID=A0A1I6MXY1_9BACT|nr:S1 RNA-binding domain-containing protein [Granulicella pectinivorans]SFS20481.1 small subunit ribosomal protein S1 [Granulicella pectinivorans]